VTKKEGAEPRWRGSTLIEPLTKKAIIPTNNPALFADHSRFIGFIV
jgi:hypothetical protein